MTTVDSKSLWFTAKNEILITFTILGWWQSIFQRQWLNTLFLSCVKICVYLSSLKLININQYFIFTMDQTTEIPVLVTLGVLFFSFYSPQLYCFGSSHCSYTNIFGCSRQLFFSLEKVQHYLSSTNQKRLRLYLVNTVENFAATDPDSPLRSWWRPKTKQILSCKRRLTLLCVWVCKCMCNV